MPQINQIHTDKNLNSRIANIPYRNTEYLILTQLALSNL